MRPTFSIICFTVLSGAGYGLLFLLGLGLALGPLLVGLAGASAMSEASTSPSPRIALAAALLSGVVLVSIGLVASLAHLGRPSRAWRALSQWRSSWLSREGVAALLTYVPVLAILALLAADSTPAQLDVALRLCGALLAAGAATTVVCTANIYASLEPIRAWHHPLVAISYLLLALYSGVLCVVAMATMRIPDPYWTALLLPNALLIAPVSVWIKWRYWRSIDAMPATPTGHATGLDRLGQVRRFEQPHTEENYLTHEMGFVLARKHSRRLRAIALCSILLAPLMTLPVVALIGAAGAWLALVAGLTGVFVERWLFFAQARHAVMAYYGR